MESLKGKYIWRKKVPGETKWRPSPYTKSEHDKKNITSSILSWMNLNSASNF